MPSLTTPSTAPTPYRIPTPESFGTRRLKCVLGLKDHPELDSDGWVGRVVFHFGPGGNVAIAPEPAPRAIGLPD